MSLPGMVGEAIKVGAVEEDFDDEGDVLVPLFSFLGTEGGDAFREREGGEKSKTGK